SRLREFAAHHGEQFATATVDGFIRADGRRPSGRHCRPVPLSTGSRCVANRVVGMFLHREFSGLNRESTARGSRGMKMLTILRHGRRMRLTNIDELNAQSAARWA